MQVSRQTSSMSDLFLKATGNIIALHDIDKPLPISLYRRRAETIARLSVILGGLATLGTLALGAYRRRWSALLPPAIAASATVIALILTKNLFKIRQQMECLREMHQLPAYLENEITMQTNLHEINPFNNDSFYWVERSPYDRVLTIAHTRIALVFSIFKAITCSEDNERKKFVSKARDLTHNASLDSEMTAKLSRIFYNLAPDIHKPNPDCLMDIAQYDELLAIETLEDLDAVVAAITSPLENKSSRSEL